MRRAFRIAGPGRVAAKALCMLVILIPPMPISAATPAQERAPVTPAEIDQIVKTLQVAVGAYVFPQIATKLAQTLAAHGPMYRTLTNASALAEQLTADLRATGQDKHLAVTFGEELSVLKNPTAAERQHAHDFDRANGYGVRSARRLPGNIGYLDLAYFSPDPEAGRAIAAAMRVVNGTDALIVDLRHNGGGSGDAEVTLASYFFSDVVQLSSVVEKVDGRQDERQHWTIAFVEGPRYIGKPVYLLISRHTHSAAEALSYDLRNMRIATVVGESSSGDATSSTGEIDLGHGFSALIPNGQLVSPITHANYFTVGVVADIPVLPQTALRTTYELALKAARASVPSEALTKERAEAIQDPAAALQEEIDGFSATDGAVKRR